MERIEAVVFDMDGVLFDTERLCDRSWREAAEVIGFDFDVELAIAGCRGLNHADTVEFFIKHFGEDFPVREFMEDGSRRNREKIEREGVPLKPGVREILEFLKEKGYKVALASSTRKPRVLEHLEETGLTAYFQEIIGGDMVEHSKPEPDIYLIACEAIGVKPENAIAVEDSPNGLKSAYTAGMKTVMVPDLVAPTPEIEKLLWQKFDSLHQMKAFMEKRSTEWQH